MGLASQGARQRTEERPLFSARAMRELRAMPSSMLPRLGIVIELLVAPWEGAGLLTSVSVKIRARQDLDARRPRR